MPSAASPDQQPRRRLPAPSSDQHGARVESRAPAEPWRHLRSPHHPQQHAHQPLPRVARRTRRSPDLHGHARRELQPGHRGGTHVPHDHLGDLGRHLARLRRQPDVGDPRGLDRRAAPCSRRGNRARSRRGEVATDDLVGATSPSMSRFTVQSSRTRPSAAEAPAIRLLSLLMS